MTKISSTGTTSESMGHAAVDDMPPPTPTEPAVAQAPTDPVESDDGGFFDDVLGVAEDIVDAAGEFLEESDSYDVQTGMPIDAGVLKTVAETLAEARSGSVAEAATGPATMTDTTREAVKDVADLASNVAESTMAKAKELAANPEIRGAMATVADTLGKVLTPDSVKVGVAVVDDAIELATSVHERFIEEGVDPLDMVRNIPGAVERVEENVNTALNDAFGDDALQITFDPRKIDPGKTLEILTGDNTELQRQARTGLALTGLEVLRENAYIPEAIASTETAQVLSEMTERNAKALGVVGAVGLGAVLGPVGIIGAVGIATGVIETPFPAITPADVGRAFEDMRTNPQKYRDLIGIHNGPVPSAIRNLKLGQTLSRSESIKLDITTGVGISGEYATTSTTRRIDDDTFELTMSIKGEGLGKLGESLQKKGMSAYVGQDGELKLKLLVTGDGAERAVAAAMNGDVTMLGMVGTFDDIEVSSGQKIGAEFDLSLGQGKAESERKALASSKEISFSSSVTANVGATTGESVLSLPRLRNDPQVDTFAEVWREMTRVDGFNTNSVKVEISGGAKLGVNPRTGDTFLELSLEGKAERQDFEIACKGTVTIDLNAIVSATGKTADQLKELAAAKPEDFIALARTYDAAVVFEGTATTNTTERISGTIAGYTAEQKLETETELTKANGTLGQAIAKLKGESFVDPRLAMMRS